MAEPVEQAQQQPLAPSSRVAADLSPRAARWGMGVLWVYFGIRLLFLAIAIAPFLPPDEATHAGVCRAFSRVLLMPDNSPSTYEFGLVTNIPWLYYWVMGKLLHLNLFGIPELTFLRLLNIPLAFGTVWYSLRLVRLLTDNNLVRLLLLAVVTNIPMFSLLSAAVSYDNLTNLLAAMAIYYLAAFFRHRQEHALPLFLLCLLGGCLTKMTMLPLVPISGLLLVLHEYRNIRRFPAALKEYFVLKNRKGLCLTLLILVCLAFNLALYAGNYLTYGTLTPDMSTVISQDAAMQYRIRARELIFNHYVEGKLSYLDALMKASDIKSEGDRADTLYLLMNYEKMKADPSLWMGFADYALCWIDNVVGTTMGIKAHRLMFKDVRYNWPLYILSALSLLGFALRWRPGGEASWLPPALAFTVFSYAWYLLHEINYPAYRYYGTPGITLQGRYLFPVMAPACALFCTFLLTLFSGRTIRLALAAATALLFICYDFPYFLAHATPEWYAGFMHR